jgi:hypothetical protein
MTDMETETELRADDTCNDPLTLAEDLTVSSIFRVLRFGVYSFD